MEMIRGTLYGNPCRWLLIAAVACMAASGSDDHKATVLETESRGPVVMKTESGSMTDVMAKGTTVGAFFMSRENGSVYRRNEMLIVGEHGMLMQERDTIVPLDLESYDFLAYSPYESSWDDLPDSVVEFEVRTDQSSDMDYVASDLMISNRMIETDDRIEAVFRHVMSKVVLHVTDKTGVFDMRFSSAVIKDIRNRSYLHVSGNTAETDASASADLNLHMLDARDRRASYAVVFPPQQLADGNLIIEVEVAGIVYDFTVSGVPALEEGDVYVCSMSMTDRGLELDDTELTDWADGGSGIMIVAYE